MSIHKAHRWSRWNHGHGAPIRFGAIRWSSWAPEAQNQSVIWGDYLTTRTTRWPLNGLNSDGSANGPYTHGGSITLSQAQAFMDGEIDAASNNSLTWWMWNWYADSNVGFPSLWQSTIFYPFHLWESSSKRSQIDSCLMIADAWGAGPPPESDWANYQSAFIPYWAQLAGNPGAFWLEDRPVIFIFTAGLTAVWDATRVQQMRDGFTGAGLPNPLIIYFGGPSKAAFAVSIGADGISNYGPNGASAPNHSHEPWSWQVGQDNTFLGPFTGLRTLPPATPMGDRRPLNESLYGYVDMPPQPNWRSHLRTRMSWIEAHKKEALRAILMYSWDERAEGGPGISPNVQEGSRFLEAIKDVATATLPNSYLEKISNNNFRLKKNGTWTLFGPFTGTPNPWNNEVTYSDIGGDTASIVVTGANSITFNLNTTGLSGFASLFLDGVLVAGPTDTYRSGARQIHQNLFGALTIPDNDPHLVELKVGGWHSPGSTGTRVEIDNVEYAQTTEPDVAGGIYPASIQSYWSFGEPLVLGPGDGDVFDFWEADYQVTLTPRTVSGTTYQMATTWTGFLGHALTQGTLANSPFFCDGLHPVDVTLPAGDYPYAGHPSIEFDGVNSWYPAIAYTHAAPATTSFDVFSLMTDDGWSSTWTAWGFGPSTMQLLAGTSTPSVALLNDNTNPRVDQNAQLTVGTWSRVHAHYSGSTGDYIQVRSTKTTGTSAGNNAASEFTLGRNHGLTGLFKGRMACLMFGQMSASMTASLDNYLTRKYGSAVVSP